VVIAPLLGFTAEGGRLGQGGGHYDRWLAANPMWPRWGWAGIASL
jgi:5-formyltetrahydrofolate cyclo-ligase